MIFHNRVELQSSNDNEKGEYCLYWMQQSQRISQNHSLEFAIEQANSENIPLLVIFGLSDHYPEANERHYAFMLEGLKSLCDEFVHLKIGFKVVIGEPVLVVQELLVHARILVMDKAYLPWLINWRLKVIEHAKAIKVKAVYSVESDLIVPVEIASNKEEYGARTIRPKILRLLDQYALSVSPQKIINPWQEQLFDMPESRVLKLTTNSIDHFLKESQIDHSVKKSPFFKGGYTEAVKQYEDFLENHLTYYNESNSPAVDHTSKMSLYLHFGQISSLELLLKLRAFVKVHPEISSESVQGYLEQLLIRRPLTFNYVYYRPEFPAFEKMTNNWAYTTMALHLEDVRPYAYSLDALERYGTHDPYWNTAMKEMVHTGYMHNYMRMYWCKKIIEWSPSYKEAYENALYLNNKYFIDGRDPNSYVGIAWCFGLHDQGWRERAVFGKLRYMNDKGLERKFDMNAYIRRIDQKVESEY